MEIRRLESGKHYSNIVVHANTVYLAGVIADNFDLDISGQSKQCFLEIDRLLKIAGSDRAKLLSVRCYIANFNDFTSFNSEYDDWIDSLNLPARATVQACAYDKRIKIELVVIAAL